MTVKRGRPSAGSAGRSAGVILAGLCFAFASLPAPAAAGSFSGPTQEVLPGAVSSGGSGSGTSAGHRVLSVIGESGQYSYTSDNHSLRPGFGNLAAWPETIRSLAASAGAAPGSITLGWTAPKADGSTGTAAAYEIRYSTYLAGSPAAGEAAFLLAASATDFISVPLPAGYGQAEQLTINGLPGGATYYFAVKARSAWDAWSYLSNGATAQARLYDPAFTGFTGAGEDYITAAWSSSGNAPGFRYRVLVSTAPDPLAPGGAIVTSSDTYNAFLSSAGLAANTTYYFRVASLAGAGEAVSGYTAPQGYATYARTPQPDGFSAVTASSMLFGWSANGNPPGTLYSVAVSTGPDPLAPGGAVFSTSDTYNSFLSSSGLAANTTYYFRAAAVNHAGQVSAYSGTASTSTLAAQPSGLYFTGVSSGSLRLNWEASGNAAGTLYRVVMSTATDPLAPAGAQALSYDVYDLYLSSGGLLPDKYYYFRAAAVNNNGVITAYTAPASEKTLTSGEIGSPAAGSVDGIFITSVTASWSLVGGATSYTLAASLSPAEPPVSIYASSQTAAAGASLFEAPALSPDTLYYLFVRAHGNGASSAWLALGPVSTLVQFAPSLPAVSGITADAMRLDWSANGNPGGTQYRVLVSTAPDPLAPGGAALVSSDTYNLFLEASGLQADTTYYFRTAGLNKTGTPTAYTAAIGSATLANAPYLSAFTAVQASSARANWTAGGNAPDTLYRVVYSVAPDPLAPEGAPVYTADVAGLYYDATGLNRDTRYYFRVAAVNRAGVETDYAYPQDVLTLSNEPVFTGFSGMGAGGITFNWSANGNAEGTQYRVAVSTAPDPLNPAGAAATVTDSYNLYFSSSGLAADTTYYFRAAAVNSGGVATAYTAARGTATLLGYAPAAAGFTNMAAESLRFNWSANGNAAGTLYRVAVSTAPDPLAPGAAAATVTDTYNLYLTSAGLAVNTTYYFRVAGVSVNGIATAYTAAASTSTLLAFEPLGAGFAGVTAGAMDFNWSANGNPDSTLYRVIAAAGQDPLGYAGASVYETYAQALSTSGLAANVTYYFRVAGVNNDGVATSYSALLATSTLANAPAAAGFSGLTPSAAGFNWTAPGNSGATLYRVAVSTAPNPLLPAGARVTYSDVYALSASSSGLTQNTTYYFRVAAVNSNGVATAYTGPEGIATLLDGIPAFSGFTGVAAGAIGYNWTANGLPGGIAYRVLASTAPDPLAPSGETVSSSDTYALSLSSSGLAGNTTYYFRAAGLNHAGAAWSYSAPQGTSTLANAPVFSAFSAVDDNSITTNWTAAGNAFPDTLYRVAVSTASDPLNPSGADVQTLETSDYSLVLAGLASQTTYYFRIAAVNNNGLVTAYTAAQSTVTRVAVATKLYFQDAVTPVDANSRYLTRLAGSSLLTYTKNTLDGAVTPPTAATQFTAAAGGAVVTWYSPPLDDVTIAGNVTFNIWARESSSQANATITAELLRSDNAGNILSVISSVLLGRAELSGTTLTAQNWVKVPASTALSNGDRLAARWYIDDGGGTLRSGYTVTATLGGATSGASGDSWVQTREALAPARPALGVLSGVAAHQMAASWSLVEGATGYTLAASLYPNNPPTDIYASSVTAAASAVIDTPALAADTTYYLFVRTDGPGASSSWEAYPATPTLLAYPPASAGFTEVGAASMRFNWSANGNADPGTQYRVLVSTAPDPLSPGGAAVTSEYTYALSLSSAGLAADTTYYFRVAGFSKGGVFTAYTAPAGMATLLPYVPEPAAFSDTAADSLRFNWTSGGNPAGTRYRVLASTAPDPAAPAGAAVTSSDTYNVFLTSAGLAYNTTYYFRVAGVNKAGVPTAYSAPAGAATNAVMPAVSGFSGNTAGSIDFAWTAAGNPAGTLYRAYVSKAPDPLDPHGLFTASADTYAGAYAPSGLDADTTYYFRVAAVGHNGTETVYTASAGTATLLAYPPAAAGFTDVAAGSLRFNWSANGNADPGTLYRVLASTAPDPLAPTGAPVTSSYTYNTFLSSSGLAANTTYYFTVAGVNKNGVSTAYTASAGTSTLLGYVPAADAFTELSTGSMRFAWTSGGNPGGTLYHVLASTAPDPLSPGGAAVTALATYSLSLSTPGLAGNTTYYFRVAGLNNNGVPTAYSQAAATSTLAAQPAGLNISGVTTHALQLNWEAAGNRAGTLYHVLLSTAPDPLAPAGAVVSSTYTYDLFMSSSGLEANKTHYFKAAAVNNNGIYTAYSALSGATLEIGQLAAPADGSITGVFVSSLAASWALVGGATGYTLAASLSPDDPPTAVYASSVTVGNGAASAVVYAPALAADTVYYLFVRANGSEVSSSWLAYGPRATLLSKAPVFSSFSGVDYTAAQFNWSANGNPDPGTRYRVYVSTAYNPLDPGGAVATSSDTYNTYLSTSGLDSNTTYYFRVAGINKDGVATVYTIARATITWVNQPAAAGFSDVDAGSMRFNWSANGNPWPRTRYTVAVSTAPDPLAPAGAAVTSVNTYDLFYSSSGLAPDTTYYFRVAAVGFNGTVTPYTAPAGTATLVAYAPAAAGFSGIGTGAVQFNWSANGNADPGTLYRVLASTAPDPLAPSGAAVTSSATYNTFLSSAGLSLNTTYYFRVAGVNKNGVATAYTAAAGTATLANIPLTAVSTFSAVSNSGFTASWNANSNPAGTLYSVRISSAADFNPGVAYQVAADTVPVDGASYTFTGLVFSTTYYFKVRAVNRNGVYTGYAELGSVKTAGLQAPAVEPVTQVSTYSITAAWQAVAQATGYTLAASVNPANPPSPVYASVATAGLSATLDTPALALGSTYFLFVRADGAAESSAWTAYPATSTLANPPLSAVSTFSGVAFSGFSVSWNANSNALGTTRYEVEVSTAFDFNAGVTDRVAFSTVPVYGPGAAFSGLNTDTYYYFRVRSAHNNGNFTGWVNLGVKKTLALPVLHEAGDAVILYGQAGAAMPQFRNYHADTNSFGGVENLDMGGNGSLFAIKTSPLTTKQEAVAAYVENGTLHVLCTDGTNWTEEWTQAVGGNETTRRFDIAYETNTGDVVVLYSNNAAGSNELGYRTKAGALDCGASGWSAHSALDPVRTSGTVQWVKMASDPRADANTVAAIWADSNSNLSALVWNGAAWENEPAAALETSLETVAAAQDVEDFDVEFESLSGDLMVVWANSAGADGVNGVRYATAAWTGGTPLHTWGSATTPPAFLDDATNLDLAANPASNEMVFASIGNAGSDLQSGYWSGSAWTNTANSDITAQAPLAGTRLVAAAWISSGTATRSVIAYNDSAATNIGWVVGNGATFTTQTDATPAPVFANPQKLYSLQQDPVNRDRLLFAVSDNNSDLFVKRLVMTTAAAFTWSAADGGAALETGLSSNTVAGYALTFWPAPPVTTFTQSAYRFFANSDSADVGAPLAAQDSVGVVPSSGTAFRLRALVDIGQVDLAVGAQSFKLQFAGRGSGTCAAPSGGTPADYVDVGAATEVAFNDNTPADGAALTVNAADPQHGAHVTVAQSYVEASNTAATLALTLRNRDAMWDFALKDNGMAAGTSYCFKLVKADGSPLNNYEIYPEVMLRPAVYLNEVYPSGDAAGDWVEFYNNSPSTVSLVGWELDYVANTIDLGGSAVPVWTAQAGDMVNAYSTFTLYGFATDLAGGQSHHLKLLNNTGALVDQAQWPVLASGQSFSRIYDGDPSFFWIDPSPTPGYANSVSTDALKINEVSYGGPDRQFVELYNASETSTRTLAGYALRNAASSASSLAFRFTRKIYPRDYAVIDFSARSADGYSFWDVFGAQGLSAAGDFLALENSTGSVVDSAVWQSGTAYSLYNYKAELVTAGNFAPGAAAYSIARGPSEGAETGSDAADFSASAFTTLASRNSSAGAATANTLTYPVNTSAPQFLARVFPLTLQLGAASGAGSGNNIVFQRTGGSADPGSPHIYRLQDIGFDLASLLQQTTAQFGLSFDDQEGAPLVSSAVYRVTFNSATGSASAPQIILGTVTYHDAVHGVSGSTSAPVWMNDASRAGAIALGVSNNSPAGFNWVALSTVAFKLLDSDLAPLSQAQARGLFEAVMLAKDAVGSGVAGVYEPGIDVSTLAYVPMASLFLDADGVSTLTVTSQYLAAGAVPAASTGTFFIVLESTRDASDLQLPFRVRFAPASASVVDGPGGLAQAFVPAAQVDTSSVTLISPAQPPLGTVWPYVLPANSATQSPVSYYTNDGGTSVSSAVYMAGVDGYLRAVRKDGTVKWSYATSPLSPIRTSPNAVTEGTDVVIYFANDNGDVYKLRDDNTSAALVWKQPVGAAVRSNVMCTDLSCTGTKLYFGADDHTVRCLNKADGTPCAGWTFAANVTAAVSGTISIDDRDTIKTGWVGLEDGKIVALQTADGASPASFATGGLIKSSPYLDARYADPNNVVYFTSTDGKLYARVSSNLSAAPTGWLGDYATPGNAAIYTSPSVTFFGTKYIFFGDDAGRLHKVDVTGTSAAGWPVQVGGAIRSSPVWVPGSAVGVAENYVYFGCDDGYIYAFNADTGARRDGWPVATGGPVRADPVIDPDSRTLVVGSTDGKTYMLNVGP